MMYKGKIGAIFIVSVLALAGVGVSYAGFTDAINIFGSVTTGTVDLEIAGYSGTWVWKVWGEGAPVDEIVITDDPVYNPSVDYPLADYMLVSYSTGREYDASMDAAGDYDGVIEFDNLFPCIDFKADILYHYVGTIPAKVDDILFDWDGDLIDVDGDGVAENDFLDYLVDMYETSNGVYGATARLFRCDEYGDELDPYEEIDVTYQLHCCHYFKLEVLIHLPQDNIFQGLTGTGFFGIGVIQWNDACPPPPVPDDCDVGVYKSVDEAYPADGGLVTYTITAENILPGGCDATDVVIEEDIFSQSSQNVVMHYVDHVASAGTYNPVDGLWTLNIGNGDTETLALTAMVEIIELEYPVFTQLCIVLDGSGSIGGSDFGVMLEGLATAVETYLPRNSIVELTVIQFAGTYANVEVAPVIIDDLNYASVATSIRAIPYRGGLTPLACGLYLAADTLYGSQFFDVDNRQVINIVTDGVPNIVSNPDKYTGYSGNEASGKADAVAAHGYMMSLLGLSNDGSGFDQDEIDVEAIDFPDMGYDWLRDMIVFPQPAYEDSPPSGPGWIRSFNTYTEFADAIYEKFQTLVEPVVNTACVLSLTQGDVNLGNDCSDEVFVYPQAQ